MARLILKPHGQLRRLCVVRWRRLTNPGVDSVPSSPHAMTPGPRHRPIAVSSGKFFRVVSPPREALVTPPLGRELAQVLEAFAQSAGFDESNPLPVHFGHGFMGLHRFHRAVDVYAVAGKGLGQWMKEWNATMRQAAATPDEKERERLIAAEKERNLGYRLYKALQVHGHWAQPPGYPIQLFGPWTRLEGPHKTISDRMLYMHRDHIHVAK